MKPVSYTKCSLRERFTDDEYIVASEEDIGFPYQWENEPGNQSLLETYFPSFSERTGVKIESCFFIYQKSENKKLFIFSTPKDGRENKKIFFSLPFGSENIIVCIFSPHPPKTNREW